MKILLLMISAYGFGQGIIPITETTLQLGYDEAKEVYYSFEKGDQILFNLHMIQGKHIREIEIVELPGNTVFSVFKADEIIAKKIKVRRRGVYKFRFYSSSLTNRACKYTIHRILANESARNFNTNWEWAIQKDTTYTSYQQDSLVGYRFDKVQKRRKVQVSVDTIFSQLIQKMERVHSITAIGKSNCSYIEVNLPRNQYFPNKENPYESIETFAWSHWMGVGQKSKEYFEKINQEFISGVQLLGQYTGYGALASLAASGVSIFNDTSIGDNVQYRFLRNLNGTTLSFNSGNGISDMGRNTDCLQGGFLVELTNDNIRRGIDVHFKIVVAQIHRKWKDVMYEEEVKRPKYVKVNKTQMHIEETKIRVPVEH